MAINARVTVEDGKLKLSSRLTKTDTDKLRRAAEVLTALTVLMPDYAPAKNALLSVDCVIDNYGNEVSDDRSE